MTRAYIEACVLAQKEWEFRHNHGRYPDREASREIIAETRALMDAYAEEREPVTRSLPTQDELADIIGEAFFDAWQERHGSGADLAAAAVLKRIGT